jgi:hypothetical protein
MSFQVGDKIKKRDPNSVRGMRPDLREIYVKGGNKFIIRFVSYYHDYRIYRFVGDENINNPPPFGGFIYVDRDYVIAGIQKPKTFTEYRNEKL